MPSGGSGRSSVQRPDHLPRSSLLSQWRPLGAPPPVRPPVSRIQTAGKPTGLTIPETGPLYRPITKESQTFLSLHHAHRRPQTCIGHFYRIYAELWAAILHPLHQTLEAKPLTDTTANITGISRTKTRNGPFTALASKDARIFLSPVSHPLPSIKRHRLFLSTYTELPNCDSPPASPDA